MVRYCTKCGAEMIVDEELESSRVYKCDECGHSQVDFL